MGGQKKLSGVTTFCLVLIGIATGAQTLLARAESRVLPIAKPELHYQEDGSFGSIKPDEPAKPAATDVSPSRSVRSPAAESTEDDANQRATSASPRPTGRPKYREIFDQLSQRDRSYGDEESASVSLGVGFGFKYFSGSLGVTLPANRYVAWGVSGRFQNRSEKELAETGSSGEADLILRIPNPTPITPFASAGPGYENWRRSKNDGSGLIVFDKDASPTANWSVGGSMRLARYVGIVGALKSTTYSERPPRVFTGDHSEREPSTVERFDLQFTFMF